MSGSILAFTLGASGSLLVVGLLLLPLATVGYLNSRDPSIKEWTDSVDFWLRPKPDQVLVARRATYRGLHYAKHWRLYLLASVASLLLAGVFALL
jgi:hypothetical protein